MSSPTCLSLAGLLWLAATPDAPPPRVGVVVSAGVNLSEQAKVDLSERLGGALTDALRVDVTAGREVARRLEGMDTGPQCFLEAECQGRVASRLDVEELLVLVAVRLGTQLQIEPTWIHVPTQRAVVRDAIVTDAVKDDLSDVLREAAPRLLPEAELRPAPPPPPPVVVTQGAPATRTATVTADGWPPTASWIAFGVGALALASGAGLGLSALSGYDRLEADGCAAVPCDPGRIDAVDDKALAADVLFGVAGAATLTGLVLWWLDAEDDGPVATVSVGPEGARAVLGGRF